MNYLVLGSNSFAGSTMVDYLLTQGHDVVGMSRSPEPSPVLLAYSKNPRKDAFTFYPFDVNKDLAQITEMIKKDKPKVIIDFAGQSMVAESWIHPEHWYQTNIVSKSKLHNFLKSCDFLERYIKCSTPEVYGSTTGRVAEDHPYNPSTPYAVSQAAIDMSLTTFYKQYQFPVIFTRFANFYGPYQQFYRIIPRTIIYALLGKKLSLHGGGVSKRAFIYGQDVAAGIDAAIQKGQVGGVYHFSDHEFVSIKQLVEMICKEMHIPFEQLAEVGPERPGKDAEYYLGVEKAMKELNWQPKVTLTEGVRHCIDWAKANIDLIKTLPLDYLHKA